MRERGDLPPEIGFAGLDSLPYYVALITEDHHVLWCNEVFASAVGKSRAACHGEYCPSLVHGTAEPFEGCPLEEAIIRDETVERDLYDGRIDAWIRAAAYPTGKVHDGKRVFLHTARDVTAEMKERERTDQLQEQRDQLQKIEAAGSLSAGIVHDLNNLLAVTLMNASLIHDLYHPNDKTRRCAREILDVTERSSALTHRFLFLNRTRPPVPSVVDVARLIRDTRPLLRSLMGPVILLELDIGAGLEPILVDVTGLEQAIYNLAINARDAIEGAGGVRISAQTVTLSAGEAQSRDLLPGTYTTVRFSDTGSGMNEDVLSHVFEPFYTTKQTGTGLGLKVVHDVVHSASGTVGIQSTAGEGTTIELVFPATNEEFKRQSLDEDPVAHSSGGGTVLIVTDLPELGQAMERTLAGAGYRSIVTTGFRDVIERASLIHGPISLAILDGESPRPCREVAQQLSRLRPETRWMFLINPVSAHSSLLDLLAEFSHTSLRKPFSREELLRNVYTCLQDD